MDKINLKKHISGQFNVELEGVLNQVLVMGGLVEQQLSDAITAIHEQDMDMARQIVANDHKVNALEVQIDEECTRIIAKRQPAASDLRLVLAIIKTITDLERIGDVAKRIGMMLLDNANKKQPPLVSMENMGRRTVKMLHEALDAFARMDVEAAIEVHKEDDKVDREYESIIRELMTFMMEDPRTIPQVLNVLWCARSLERVGDRVQHLCEYIIYFVKGKDVRHTSDEDIHNMLGR
ncbi:phosphate transport system regulatory protein PhoU [Zobellella denitrificans]|jgi:phosphate transport system protein|uniref:Phosphate-specific transport system accessory protein PhoU n=1 Tax=Zobellella denitrificans TaxID=347534 RepID=A0A231N4E8_9GAMM|nr:phosphate signaling complex protein PhoU [Zobellella denitrificans]ATG73522.1 transcriptional regulator PhoU [Zobellella denitrificans]OXS17149.1 phosphate transport system regulatory protein PhoU [Zobellella denitrificans]